MNGPRLAAAVLSSALLAACGGASLWPFGDSGGKEIDQKPANATEYVCQGGKTFYVRNLDAHAIWLIAPDRELRMEKPPGSEALLYRAGRTTLEINGQDATLIDPPSQFAGCRRADGKR